MNFDMLACGGALFALGYVTGSSRTAFKASKFVNDSYKEVGYETKAIVKEGSTDGKIGCRH